jgi:hypothetical protein
MSTIARYSAFSQDSARIQQRWPIPSSPRTATTGVSLHTVSASEMIRWSGIAAASICSSTSAGGPMMA